MKDTDGGGGLYKTMSKHPLIAGGLLLAGAGLAYASVKAMSSNPNDEPANQVHVATSITIAKSPEELFRFWRNFNNLPRFMKNLVSVSDLDNGRSHWVAQATGGIKVEWDAEVFNEIPNQLIAWQSVDSADVNNAGSVRFEEAPGGRGTYVHVTMNYNPPAGKVGAKIAGLLGTEPAQLIREDLRRLKQVLEAGEIPTIDGQSSGRESEASAAGSNNEAYAHAG
jgi:uncharacterized membrane protein